MYATMLVGTVARYVLNEIGNCHAKICTWHAGMNTTNVSMRAGASYVTEKTFAVVHVEGITVCLASVIPEKTETNLKTIYKLF